jgi:hypothetical protein
MHWIDPACLPETRGMVRQFLLNPHGEIDGVVLGKDRQVHLPPHLSQKLAKHIAVGDRVKVRGVKLRGASVIAAVAIESQAGVRIVDEGPDAADAGPGKPLARRPMDASGEVTLSLYGPKGELRGALLADGTSLRMPPHAAQDLQDYLAPGAQVHAWGEGVKNKHGRTIDVYEIAALTEANS